MRIALMVAAAMIVAACSGPESKAIEAAKTEIREATRDPDSVKFRDITARNVGDRVVVCGEFNAMNAYGGYVGFRPFMHAGGPTGVLYPRNEREVATRELVLSMCKTLRNAK
jgi:hypothetical protein